jgi:peptidoglycan-associated lipoprotein
MGPRRRCSSAEFKAALNRWQSNRVSGWLSVVVLTASLYGCGGKKDISQAPPPPPPPAPVASINASPAAVRAGETTLLIWETHNATDVRIEPLGAVEANGSKEVSPSDSTTYRLFAKGPGGVQGASVRVTVNVAAAPTPAAEEDLLSARGGRQDVFFNTDEFSIRPDQEVTVHDDAEFLKQHPDLNIAIEGHCDELGSTEYNLALGESRANEVKSELVRAGVEGNRIGTISYGKERPFCNDENEDCWKQNRRAHVVAVTPR